MQKIVILAAVAAALLTAVVGCKTDSGSREYIPGKGWVPND